jgi:hypothetical protein
MVKNKIKNKCNSESGSKVGYACSGCKHQGTPSNTDFCYMFEDKPDILPCGQHDKYKEHRQLTGRMIRRNPFIYSY